MEKPRVVGLQTILHIFGEGDDVCVVRAFGHHDLMPADRRIENEHTEHRLVAIALYHGGSRNRFCEGVASALVRLPQVEEQRQPSTLPKQAPMFFDSLMFFGDVVFKFSDPRALRS